MINNFPRMHDDELLYSVIARYHTLSGNVSCRKTLIQLFKIDSIVATLEFNGYLNNLVKELPESLNINSNYLIERHSMFPIYEPFLPLNRKNIAIEKMKNSDASDIKYLVGLIAGSILKKSGIMYCPECASYELDVYGEAYIHRLHQVEGVVVCPVHRCLLNTYRISQTKVSRLQFIMLKPNLLELKSYHLNNSNLEELIKIANGFKFLLENQLGFLNQNLMYKKYLKLLNEKGFVVNGKRIRQKDLFDKFLQFYGEELLNLLNSCPKLDNEYNWLKVLTRKPGRLVHPLRQVLFIIFMCGSVEDFFRIKTTNKISNMKYPCLNPICENYEKNTISKFEIKLDHKTENQIGTFYCDCGFVYSRNMSRDIFSAGKIITYGTRWENTLKTLIQEEKYSLRGIARSMRCDPKTVIKYADKLGIKDILNTCMNIKYPEHSSIAFINCQRYREDIIEAMKQHPDFSRTEIRQLVSKQYMWLYKNDKVWLEENLPGPNSKKIVQQANTRVDWQERDEILLDMLKNEYRRLLQLDKIPRITKSLIGRRTNCLALLEKCLDKLPGSKSFLNEITESVEEFQKRRVNKVIDEMQLNDERLATWKIMRMAGLKGDLSIIVELIMSEREDIS